MRHTLPCLLLLAACATGGVRQLRRDDAGGSYRLEGDDDIARDALQQAMDRHCGPGNHEIVQTSPARDVEYRCKNAPTPPTAGSGASSGGGGVGY